MAGRLAGRKKTQINGSDYDILPHPATEALVLVRRLGAFVEFDTDNPIKAIQTLCLNSLEKDPNLELLLGLFRHTQINGASVDKDVFDDHYGANYGELIDGIKAVVETNNFLQAMGSIGALTGK
jgi:hypothetical protein